MHLFMLLIILCLLVTSQRCISKLIPQGSVYFITQAIEVHALTDPTILLSSDIITYLVGLYASRLNLEAGLLPKENNLNCQPKESLLPDSTNHL